MRKSVGTIFAMIVVVAMAVALWRYTALQDASTRVTLASVSGGVTLEGVEGERPARNGVTVDASDQLVTDEEGRAVLSLEGGTRLRIGPDSTVLVRAVDETGVSLELDGGAIRATVRPNSGAVNVSGGGVTVQATDADFGLGVRDDVAVVETTRGEVALMGVDEPRLAAGQRAVVEKRTARIGPIPDSLLLDVVWPDPKRTRAETSVVSGTTSPGAQVTISGSFGEQLARADATGRFTARVPLAEGGNPVAVRAVDLLGQEAAVDGVLQTRDTRGPTFDGGVEYGNP